MPRPFRPALLATILALPGAPVLAEGAELVGSYCAACHNTALVDRSMGYDRDGWAELIATMIDLRDSPDLDPLLDHLAAAHPPNEDRAPTLIDGDVRITFTEWVSPTPGQRTRDPVEAPDGSYWWVGQWADIAGRIDPATGEMTEFPLPAGSRPHTVTADAQGNIWYTGNGNGTMGMLDPATGEVTVYDMPPGGPGDPHSAIFDGDGILWFTAQRANQIGRLDPATGQIDIVDAPTPNSRPYGIKISPVDGAPWVAANGSNRLYRVDPASMEITTFETPDPGTTIRRLDFASDGTVWFVNSGLGRVGSLNPDTGEVREWDSPSGARSHPYAIVVVDDVVWYNESFQRPDALVRFDPATEKFQSWPILSGGVHAGIIRHMRRASDGGILIHQSSTNRVMKVDITARGG
jgi:virginiamycin B lyase